MTLLDICIEMGCYGVGDNCPGDIHCRIVRKMQDIKTEDMKPEITAAVNENFWELIDDTK